MPEQIVYGIYHNPVGIEFTIFHLAFSIRLEHRAPIISHFFILEPHLLEAQLPRYIEFGVFRNMLNLSFPGYVEFHFARL